MYGGGYYRMDSMAARPYYGYQNAMAAQQNPYQPQRMSFYGGAAASPSSTAQNGNRMDGFNGAPGASPAGGAASPSSGYAVGAHKARPMQPVGQLNRMGSFSMQHDRMPNGSFHGAPGAAAGGPARQPSFGSFGSTFGSFRAGGYNGSTVSNPDAQQLQRVNSGMGFPYSYGSFVAGEGGPASGGGLAANGSLMNFGDNAGGPRDAYGNSSNGASGGPSGGGMQRNNSMSGYNYGSFANGVPGIGPETSITSMGSHSVGSGYGGGFGAEDDSGSSGVGDIYNLQRQDSQNSLQRQYSISGQFFQYGAPSGPMAAPVGGVKQGFMLNGRSGGVMANGPMNGSPMGRRPPGMGGDGGPQQPQQRRLGGDGGMKSSDDLVTEGAPTALGRKNSVSNMLERRDSQKRVGMYFKNKEAKEEDVEYKKDGDPGTTKTASSKNRDPSLVNSVKPILLYDASEDGSDGQGTQNDVEIDGKTVRAVKPGNEEVQKYDMREVLYVNVREDVEVNGDSLEEIRDQFFYGANVGMMMADADCPAAEPTGWFSWNALRSVVKGVFGKIDAAVAATRSASFQPKYEFTVAVTVLQDDQMLDLLGDDSDFSRNSYHLDALAVAESPLFGNVPNGAVFVVVESADEFNDTIDACLERANGFFRHEDETNNQNLDDVAEYGIVLVTCVLKQTRKSQSTGKEDILVSSIFGAGVGDGIIHYNRIMDKNPAEPRALFYSVLHRSVHSTAIFSLKANNGDVFGPLSTLQRFGKVDTRKPKVGSVRMFVAYAEYTIPKIKNDLEDMKEGRQKLQTQRFLERLELMSEDAAKMLEDPEGCVPKTYI